ncbi:MAG: AAA family ATPase, partial [Candidatus Thorarchaeota archaeon]
VLSLGDFALRSGCVKEQDLLRDTGVIDEDCLVEAIDSLLDEIAGRVIVEGHYIDLVPYRYVEVAVVLRTHPEVLRQRLIERGYSRAKVDENVEAEVMGVCQLDAIDAFGEEKVYEIETTQVSPDEAALTIAGILEGATHDLRIDWMEQLEREGRLDDFLTPDWRGPEPF